MSPTSSDPDLSRRPAMAARPLIQSFMRSGRCPEQHRYHAALSLGLLALFVSMIDEESDSRGLPWHRLSPEALVSASLDEEASEVGFLHDLLDVSATFYSYLGEHGVLQRSESLEIQTRLVKLALGFA